eukprot:1924-Heterococcus_DN1.PRE.3
MQKCTVSIVVATKCNARQRAFTLPSYAHHRKSIVMCGVRHTLCPILQQLSDVTPAVAKHILSLLQQFKNISSTCMNTQ